MGLVDCLDTVELKEHQATRDYQEYLGIVDKADSVALVAGQGCLGIVE